MFVPFNQLSADSRIWIYQINRAVSIDEQKIINERVTAFCEQWKAHDKPLQSSFSFFYNQFVVLAVDEKVNRIGGCSIDGSVRIIRELQRDLGVNFLSRTNIACWIKDRVEVYSIARLKECIATGILSPYTLIFNNLITIKKDLNENWKIPLKSSWVAKQLSDVRIESNSWSL